MNLKLCRRQRDWATPGIIAFLLVLFQSLLWPVNITLPSGLTPLRQPPRDSKELKRAKLPPGDEIEPALRNVFEKTKRLFLTELADRLRS